MTLPYLKPVAFFAACLIVVFTLLFSTRVDERLKVNKELYLVVQQQNFWHQHLAFLLKKKLEKLGLQVKQLEQYPKEVKGLRVVIGPRKEERSAGPWYFLEGTLSHIKEKNCIGGTAFAFDAKILAAFLKKAYPHINKICVIRDENAHDHQLYTDFQEAAELQNIQLQKVSIFRSAELYLIPRAIDFDIQAMITLSEPLILEGIDKVAKAAYKLGVPYLALQPEALSFGANLALGASAEAITAHAAQDIEAFWKSGKKKEASVPKASIKVWLPAMTNQLLKKFSQAAMSLNLEVEIKN